MNDVVTFFRDRENDGGATYQLEVEGAKDPTRIAAYAQRPVDARVLQSQTVDARDLQASMRDLRSAIQGQGGGGILVVARDEGRWRMFTVTHANAKTYAAPERCVVLSPGRPPAQLIANGGECRFPAGSHVLVPINQEAEQRLQDFVAYLAWLSPDLESLVLNAIRRPSLDKRLDRVETRVFAETTDQNLAFQPSGSLGQVKAWMARSVPAPVIRVAAAVLLVLLLSVNSVLLYGLHSRLEPAGDTDASTVRKPAPVEPFAEEIKELFDAIEDNEDPLLRKLADVHFASVADGSWKDEQPVLLGLIKLQILALLDKPEPGLDFLRSSEEVAATNAAYKDVQPKLAKAPHARKLLQALACRVESSSELTFRKDCDKAPARDIERGLRDLTKFVEGRRP